MKIATIVKIVIASAALVLGGFAAALASGVPIRPSRYTEIHDNRVW